MVQVLGKREQLKLAVPGQYSESADAPVLRDRAMRAEILRRAGHKVGAGEEPGPLDLPDRAQRVALRETFSARQRAPALEQLRAESERAAAAPLAAADSAPTKREQAPLWRRALNVAQGEPNLTDPAAFYAAIGARLGGHPANWRRRAGGPGDRTFERHRIGAERGRYRSCPHHAAGGGKDRGCGQDGALETGAGIALIRGQSAASEENRWPARNSPPRRSRPTRQDCD